MENAGVENAGVDSRGGKCRSKSYGTPTRDYIEKTSSYFVGLVLILLTELRVLVIVLPIVAAFVFCILVAC